MVMASSMSMVSATLCHPECLLLELNRWNSRIPPHCFPTFQGRDHYWNDLQLYRKGHSRCVSSTSKRPEKAVVLLRGCHPVNVNFFSDIHIPASLLFEGAELYVVVSLAPSLHSNSCLSIADEQTFTWRHPDAPEDSTFYFDVGEIVRFRVESEEWHDHAPTGPTQSEKGKERLQQQREHQRGNGQLANGDAETGFETVGEMERRAPYVVIVGLFFSTFRSTFDILKSWAGRGKNQLTFSSTTDRDLCALRAWAECLGGEWHIQSF